MSRFKLVFMCIAVLLCAVLHGEEIMWWMVDDSATVDGGEIKLFLENYAEDDTHWCAARVKVTGEGIETHWLDIESPGYGRFDGREGVYIGDLGWEWGTGNWATQSPLDGLDREVYESALFQMELGYLTFDEAIEAVDWITIAETDPIAKSILTQHMYERGSIAPADYTQWVPTEFHTIGVPEPRTGLLLLLGLVVLMLRRPNMRIDRI